jgi:hypothetical protein
LRSFCNLHSNYNVVKDSGKFLVTVTSY